MKTLLAAAALVTFGAPAFAKGKTVLPTGSWGYLVEAPNSRPICTPKPNLIIKEKLIVVNLDNGQGRCTVISLKDKKAYLSGKFKCEWDKNLLPGEYERQDGDDSAFSIYPKGKYKIIYNNVLYGLCQ